MIERFAAKNFGCLKETSLALTRVHALVGPNDSGKSTILAALHAARGIETGRFHAGPIDLRYSPGAEFRVSRGTGTEAYELRGAVLVWTRWGADGRMHEQSIPFGSSPTAVAQRDDVRGS